MTLVDLKWNADQLGIDWDLTLPDGELPEGFWEPQLVQGDQALIQSLFISLRDNPLTRALYQAEPTEAAELALRLMESLEAENSEILPGSLRYQLEGEQLSISLGLTNDQGVTTSLYFENIFYES